MKRLLIFAALLLAGCSDPVEPEICGTREVTVDVIHYTMAEIVQMDLIARLVRDGWDCPSEPYISSNGVEVGRQYTCTICE